MKTIGYVLPDFPVLSQTFVGNEMRAMARLGHRIVPLAIRRADGPGQPEDAALAGETAWLAEVDRRAGAMSFLRSLRSLHRWLPFALRQRDQRPRSLVWAAARLAAVARARGCSHLHAHFAQGSTAIAIVAARMMGVPVSFVGHGYDVYAAPADLPLKLAAADFAVAVCADMAADFAQLAANANVATVHCGVDPARFSPCRDSQVDAELRLLCIGRLVDSKGIDDLLHAVALARREVPVQLTVVGHGPMRQKLESLMAELGLAAAVRFVGAVPSAWIAEQAARHDVLVAPFREGANGTRDTGPLVVKEALAMGLSVIASRFMGLKEIVAPDCGVLVPVGDRAALAEAIVRMARLEPEVRRAMGAAGRERVLQRFTLEGQAKALSALIEAC